jgi:hypothetical protein
MSRALAWLRRRGGVALTLLVAAAGLVLVVVGVALIFLPAGLIATGLALFAALTFDPAAVRKLTWPR